MAHHAPVISIAVILLVVVAGFSMSSDQFLTSTNLLNVLRQSAPALVVAVAQTLVITAGGIDLSVGSVAAFAGTTCALLLSGGMDPTLTFAVVLLIGGAIGLANGWFIAYQRLPAFIVTLATLSLALGASQLEAKGFSIAIERDSWILSVGQDYTLGMPNVAILAVLIALVGWIVLARTAFGRHLQGIGSNEQAVRRAGVPTTRVLASVYTISGAAAALAGILIVARLQSGASSIGTGLELQVIAAVVLGGTNLFGGRGTMVGTVFGVLTIALITNGLILMRVEPFWVSIVQGAILLFAIWANARVFSRWMTVRR
jgi:simple sugar transport system permease protein